MAARARAMDGSPDLKWRGARRMGHNEQRGRRRQQSAGKKGDEEDSITDGEGPAGAGVNALPSFISYTSTDTKAKLSESIAIMNQIYRVPLKGCS